jgi:putative NADH-flavin reductase
MRVSILIMGATSGIGALDVIEATGRALPVRAFARSAHKLTATDLVEPLEGDARSSEDVIRALSGVRSVIYPFGIK